MGTELRYAAFDLDGTLLDDAGRPLTGIVEGLHRLRDQGLTLILVTGRTLAGFVQPGLPRKFLDCFADAVLLYEGDAVFDRATGVLRPRLRLPADLAPAISAAREVVVDVDGSAYAGTRRAAVAYAMAYRIPRERIAVGPPPRESGPSRVVVFDGGSGLDLAGMPVRAKRIEPFGATVLSPRDGGKAAGLAEHLGTGLGGVIAFGNGDDDAPLLARSSIGVAVRHGSDAAVAAASLHLTESIADFLRRLDRHQLARLGTGDTT